MIPELLIAAMIVVESGGNPLAIGDNGQAYGILQIHNVVIIDVNRVYGTDYVHNDAFNTEKAKQLCRLYLSIYATEQRLGRIPTLEDYARIWNGGPNGYRKPSTIKYWKRVKENNETNSNIR